MGKAKAMLDEIGNGIYSKQIGCGYCRHDDVCPDRNPKINKAKLGCLNFVHHNTERVIGENAFFKANSILKKNN